MIRKIFGVVVGYIAMTAIVFISFTVLYLILGAESSFEPGSYQVSTIWIAISIVLSVIAAILGGVVCMLISKEKKAAIILAGIVLVLGLLMAIPVLSDSGENVNLVRKGNVPNMEAMQKAKQPTLIAILNPFIGAIGVVVGAGLIKPKKEEA